MVLDSGAELIVCPGNFHELAWITPKVPGRDLIGIGGDSLSYQGERRVVKTLTDENNTKVPAVVNFAVADVTNAVLSLGLMVDAGMEFLLSKNRGCWMSKDVFDVGKLALEIERDGNTFLVHQADGEIRPKGNSAHVFAVTQDESLEENLNYHTEHHEDLDHHTEHQDRNLDHHTRCTQYYIQEELPSSSGAPKHEAEVSRHNATHVPYASWCPICVKAGGK